MRRAFLILLIALALCTPHARAGNELAVGSPAPPMTMTTLDGRHIDTRALRGKVVILTFWATWCAPCRDELPQLSRYAQQHARDGLIVLAFSLDTPDKIDDVRAVAKGLSFPVGLLGDPHAPGYGRIWHLPVNFTIDRNGNLADNGWTDKDPMWTSSRLDRVVTPLLNAPR